MQKITICIVLAQLCKYRSHLDSIVTVSNIFLKIVICVFLEDITNEVDF